MVGDGVGTTLGVVVGEAVGDADTITQGVPIAPPKIVQWWHEMLGGDSRVYLTVTDSPGSTQATRQSRLNPPTDWLRKGIGQPSAFDTMHSTLLFELKFPKSVCRSLAI
jgi:hypothetical protein